MLNNSNGFWASDLRCSSPKRIISTVPSQTELLSYFGLEREVVGLTLFCVHPKNWFQNKIRIGGTKNLNIQKILDLKPDFILANKEENVQEQIEKLAAYIPVYVTDVCSVEDAYQMMMEVGGILNVEKQANHLVKLIQEGFKSVPLFQKNVCYLIWKNPYMTIGADTFISDCLKKAGCSNVFAHQLRYPEITVQDIAAQQPDVVLLSSEPYPFREKHILELQHEINCNIMLVDGELFSWYGSRLLNTPNYLKHLYQQLSDLY